MRAFDMQAFCTKYKHVFLYACMHKEKHSFSVHSCIWNSDPGTQSKPSYLNACLHLHADPGTKHKQCYMHAGLKKPALFPLCMHAFEMQILALFMHEGIKKQLWLCACKHLTCASTRFSMHACIKDRIFVYACMRLTCRPWN